MKELAFLMFIIGCGYAALKLAACFSRTPIRRRYFAIPSQTSFNILWGFSFYLGFAALTFSPLWLRTLSSVITTMLLSVILYRYMLLKRFRGCRFPCANRILAANLRRQQQNDKLVNQPYNRDEALAVLGLPPFSQNTDSLVGQRLSELENLQKSAPELPYLPELLSQLKKALSLK